jgi:hypothetical protein
MSFKLGDYVYLKLAPRFIGPFKITEERRRIEDRISEFPF